MRIKLLILFLLGMGVSANPISAQSIDYHAVRGRPARGNALDGRIDGRLEGELHCRTNHRRARTQPMNSFGSGWSGDAHLLWDGRVDEASSVQFDVDRAGRYLVKVRLTKAPDYGRFTMTLGTGLARDEVDLYSPRVELAETISLGPVSLPAGETELSFRLLGANVKAKAFRDDRYLLGLDYLQLESLDGAGDSPTAPTIVAESMPVRRPSPLSLTQLTQLMRRRCHDCHGLDPDHIEGDLDLTQLTTKAHYLSRIDLVHRMLDAIEQRTMPPPDAPQPTATERDGLRDTLDALLLEFVRSSDKLPPW